MVRPQSTQSTSRQTPIASRYAPDVWKLEWNVNIQAVGTSEQTIKYLAPYVFKVAISDHRIAKVEGRTVTIRYRKTGSNRDRTMNMNAMEFIRRFLQHVLPTGFMKVRYYGFMSPNASVSLDRIRGLIELGNGFDSENLEQVKLPEPEPLYCSSCGGKLRYVCSLFPVRTRHRGSSPKAILG